MAKIETPEAIRNLPELIVYAVGKQPSHQSKKTPQLRALNSWNLFENKVNI